MLFKKYLLFIFFFYNGVALAQDFKPTLAEIDSIYEYGDTEQAASFLKKKIHQLENKNATLLLAKHYHLLGEIYYYTSDIGEAYKYWQKGGSLIKKSYGANSIYAAENYSLLARYYSFKINIDSAFYFAEKSLTLCRKKKDSLPYISVHKIYREYAYALKIKREKFNCFLARDESKVYLDSALYFITTYYKGNKTYAAQIFHDMGNLFTDKVLFYKLHLDTLKKGLANLKTANYFYDKALAIRTKAWGTKHDKIAMLYYVKALSYYYYNPDSLGIVFTLCNKGLYALCKESNVDNAFTAPNPAQYFLNPMLALTLLRFKADRLYELYKKTNNPVYLNYCYTHCKEAVLLWQNTFKNLKSNEINTAFEIYLTSPFDSAILYANEYYQLTKSNEAKNNVFIWIELHKYSVILKSQLDKGLISFQSTNFSATDIQNKLQPNQAVLQYYCNYEHVLCLVLTKNSFTVFPENKLCKINKPIDSLLYFLQHHQAANYCKVAKQVYDTILQPYLKNIPAEINHLIISAHGKLNQVPFDALILNKTTTYTKAKFVINRYNIRYALSCNLLYVNKNNKANKNITIISPQYKQQNNLPFSKQVINYLTDNFILTDANNSGILHVAAHAFCDYSNSRNSYILMSDTQKLFVGAIATQSLKYKLAVLTACQTANGNIEAGEGVINFSRGFYLAGVTSTITSLWKVDDEATAGVIKNFYTNLIAGQSAINSLYTAKLNYLKNTKTMDDYDPYYWAGLIYTGNDVVLQKENTNCYWIVFFVILGVAGALFLVRNTLIRKKLKT